MLNNTQPSQELLKEHQKFQEEHSSYIEMAIRAVYKNDNSLKQHPNLSASVAYLYTKICYSHNPPTPSYIEQLEHNLSYANIKIKDSQLEMIVEEWVLCYSFFLYEKLKNFTLVGSLSLMMGFEPIESKKYEVDDVLPGTSLNNPFFTTSTVYSNYLIRSLEILHGIQNVRRVGSQISVKIPLY